MFVRARKKEQQEGRRVEAWTKAGGAREEQVDDTGSDQLDSCIYPIGHFSPPRLLMFSLVLLSGI